MKPLLLLLAAAAALSAQWGGTIRFAVQAEPKELHPWRAAESASSVVAQLTSGHLIHLNRRTQKVEPALAASWKWTTGGRTVTFDLRKDVKFPDGTPFTADDVAASINGMVDPAQLSPKAESLRVGGQAPRVRVVGPHRVTIEFAAAPSGWERRFSQLPVLSARSFASDRPMGLGPFVLAARKPGVMLEFKRNPRYWRTGPGGRALPYADGVELLIQANADTELLRLERGEIDFINRVSPDVYQRLAARQPQMARNLGPSLDPELLWFNLSGRSTPAYKNEWFASRNFRQAVSLAIRREDLVRIAFQGLATPARSSVSEANPAFRHASVEPERFDLAAARKLLLKDGFRLQGTRLTDRAGRAVEFSLVTNAGNAARHRMATLIQQDLKAIGIEVRIAALDFPSLVERISRTLAYDACLLGQNNVDPDPNGLMNIWLSSGANTPWHPRQPKPSSPWEAEIDEMMRAQSLTADPAKRRKYFGRVQEIARAEQPVLFLVYKNVLSAVGPRLVNAAPSLLWPHLLWNIDELQVAPAGAGTTQVSSLRN